MTHADHEHVKLTLASRLDPDWPDRPVDPEGDPSLDPNETSGYRPPPDVITAQTDRASQLARNWRHSHWAGRRERTYRALLAAGVPQSRLDRFSDCGSQAYVLRHKHEPDRYILASNRCHDRFCEACQRERRRTLAANILDKLPPGKLRFMTLTLKSTADSLHTSTQRLYKAWKQLRLRLCKDNLLTGGIAFLEITRNSTTKHWHPHLHVLCQGKYIPQTKLRDLWFKITGDSYIVDIREVRGPREAAQYILKYAGQGIGRSVWNDHQSMVECINVLSGKRTFNTFGKWHSLGLTKHDGDGDQWEYLCSLAELLARHDAGDYSATKILHQIANQTNGEPLDVRNDADHNATEDSS